MNVNKPAATSVRSKLFNNLVYGLSLLLAVGLPVSYFCLDYSAQSASLQTKADVKAEIVTQSISASPDMWRYEGVRLQEVLTRFPVELINEGAEIRDLQGVLVAQSPQVLSFPIINRSADIFDSGVRAGSVIVQSSIKSLLLATGLLAMVGTAMAVLLLYFLRRHQRHENYLLSVIFEERELARVTLESIGDAVITTDLNEIVVSFNPTAERLTQWRRAEAIGTPLSEVFIMLAEHTFPPMPALASRVLDEQPERRLVKSIVVLSRRDKSMLPIEVSSAPLLDRQSTMIGHVIAFRDVTKARELTQRTWEATHDALTGLINRREFESRVDVALLSAKNLGEQHVLCYLDLDQFKVINDTCGHAAGDALLVQLSDVLQPCLRVSDSLARLGGDEFGVLLKDCPLDNAKLIAANLLAAVRNHRFVWQGKIFNMCVSIGLVAINPTHTRADIFTAADAACYTAKDQGRNRVYEFSSDDVYLTQRQIDMSWTARLSRALEDERLVLYYQSYLPLDPQREGCRHMEILLRLIDEDGNLVPPGVFLPAAERYNIMPAIDRWVIKTIFARYKDLQAQLGSSLTCAINISGTTLNSEGILEFIVAQTQEHQLPINAICFEITETAAINNLRQTKLLMQELGSRGFLFALDDFGVGMSSLAYLKLLPVNYLKIDGSFVKNIETDQTDHAIVDAINRVAHILGLKTIGEYAESEGVICALRGIGVDFAQGYGFHRPQALPLPLTQQNPESLCATTD